MKIIFKTRPIDNLILILIYTLGFFGCKEIPADDLVLISSIDVIDKTSTTTQQSSVIYYNFDQSNGAWFENNMNYPYSAVLSAEQKKSGKSLKVELRKGENIRAEYGTDPKLARKEGWFGFSLFFPLSYEKDNSIESIVQWQAYPDFVLGETWRSAPLFLGVLNDRLVVDIKTDSKKITVQPNWNFERIDLGPVSKNNWTDFVFHIKWASDNTGQIEIWKNNTLVVTRFNKPNCYNDTLFPYFKVGIYKWDWEGKSNSVTTKRTIYVDDIRLGNEKANYDQVYPHSVTN